MAPQNAVMSSETEDDTHLGSLSALPLELREQIYQYLLTPSSSDLIIRSLFIRQYYRNVFMTQQTKEVCTSLLRVCKQIYQETLPILYSMPLWRCGCRAENLASQIGILNFGLIRRMQIDADDLPLVVLSLSQEQQADYGNRRRLRYVNLEMLLVEGYQATAITSIGDKRSREEALRLCMLAESVLEKHPTLSLLAQRDKVRGNGGSDAVDPTMGRVRWRFLRYERDIGQGEHVVDLSEMLQLLGDMLKYDEKEGIPRRSSLPTGWTDTGVFQQYPYLLGHIARNA